MIEKYNAKENRKTIRLTFSVSSVNLKAASAAFDIRRTVTEENWSHTGIQTVS